MSPNARANAALAADGAIACFSNNLVPFSLNADRAPQLKRGVRPSLLAKVRMVSSIEALKAFWLRQGIKLRHGATEDEFAAFEGRYNTRLPEDLREYFAAVNGFDGSEHWMTDNDVITFLGLDEMKQLSEYWSPAVADSDSYFVFADYSLAAHVYAIRLGASGRNDVVVVYDQPVKVARSFSEFIEGYLENNDAVLFPEPQA